MKNKEWIIVVLILVIVTGFFIFQGKNEEAEKTKKHYSNIDKNIYLQNGKMFVIGQNGSEIEVAGDFSEMQIDDYSTENHQSNTDFGNLYFYYNLNKKIYLVMSDTAGFKSWITYELTEPEIGVPSNSKIKYIRINGNYGYIFYVEPNGSGKILKSETRWKRVA